MVFGKGQKVAVTGGAVFGGVYLAEVLVYVGQPALRCLIIWRREREAFS